MAHARAMRVPRRIQCTPQHTLTHATQVGVGEVLGNPLVKALEEAVRGRGAGDAVELELQGGDYQPELVFTVPRGHAEIERLQGRYRSCAPPAARALQHQCNQLAAAAVVLSGAMNAAFCPDTELACGCAALESPVQLAIPTHVRCHGHHRLGLAGLMHPKLQGALALETYAQSLCLSARCTCAHVTRLLAVLRADNLTSTWHAGKEGCKWTR